MATQTHQKASRAEKLLKLPPKVMRVLWYWWIMPWLAAKFMCEHTPQSRFFVFGHFHRMGIWHIKGRIIINTGSYGGVMSPCAVVIENSTLGVVPVQRVGNAYHLATRARNTFELAR